MGSTTGVIYLHLKVDGTDVAVSARDANTTAETMTAVTTYTASATSSLAVSTGISTSTSTANLVAGSTYPLTLIIHRIA